ncbi:MAG: [protein-PII] uridylyltransferase, partial [Gammaproteobacteria bacterium]|nr:[protein-PII] uridylyltransferase [Gammaproteobacteria bacterium]
MRAAFETGTDSSEIVYSRARLIDLLLAEHWAVQIGDLDHPEQIALVATGGYGRAELHPCSDIDLLILLNNRCRVEKYRSFVSKFVTLLWDAGLNVGHSVRTIAQCDREARNDITIATNLLESRLIAGPEPLFSEMQRRVGPNKAWSTERFFRAKLAEQQDRHRKYGETGYRLEPNLKESPGGLRDAQMIGWVAKSHFGVADPAKLLNRGFLNRQEYDELINARAFLWRIRVALHFLAGRSEDQLLFDHQRQLAPMLGFGNRKGRRGVEGFMRQYYRSVTTLRRLNEMLLQYFQEAILGRSGKIRPINERFQSRGGYLEARDSRLFEQQPSAMLELFLIMEQQRPKLEGVRAGTIRQLRNSLSLINAEFRADPVTSELFMAIFHQPKGVSHELQRMNRYGVMAAYIPEFDRVTGLMQHDLFHIYTVDEHTLILIRNLRRFAVPEWQHDLPTASGIFANLPKPQLLYLAGLFHDIGKGRGGDHSAIGARIATRFCRRHGLSFADAHLVSWLVGNHLKMSMVSQRQDISDPDVLAAFADLVGDSTRLDYLLLLTIADMRATNPNVWNDWKASLLFKLYDGTRRVLARGIGSAPDRQQRIRDLKAQALELIDSADNERARTQAFWRHLEDSYWLRHSPREMAWHGRVLAKRWGRTTLASSNKEGAGSTALLVYAPD